MTHLPNRKSVEAAVASWQFSLDAASHQAPSCPTDPDILTVLAAAKAWLAGPVVTEDVRTHLNVWRDAIKIAQGHAEVSPPDIDDKAYWQHESAVLDRIEAALDAKDGVSLSTCKHSWVQDEEGTEFCKHCLIERPPFTTRVADTSPGQDSADLSRGEPKAAMSFERQREVINNSTSTRAIDDLIHHLAELRTQRNEAFRLGAEAMRELIATTDKLVLSEPAKAAIRALPLPEEPKP